MKKSIQISLVIIFCLSGFAGLIYESIWSHYLKLFLGHAAYAQTLVLIIFMGGMAIGSWLSNILTHKRRLNLLLAYALVEGVIGLLALVFHGTFVKTVAFSFDYFIPLLDNPALVHIWKWSIAALLIAPQSILLGATFPLMSTGFLRRFPGSQGQHIATLYFANSAGACIGVLTSGFFLIRTVGLPGTILTAGIINMVLACLVWLLVKTTATTADYEALAETPNERVKPFNKLSFILLSVAALTGTASFVYEIVWIRMLSLVLGSSTHAFELMLSAFILGLALGSFFIRKHIKHLANPLKTLAYIQLAMGLLAASTTLLYNSCFEMMSFFYEALKQNEQGYILFNVVSHFLALIMMLPTTFCAGMTLPLLTYLLLNNKTGEAAISRIYSLNTLGSILGVIIAIHIFLPFLGLKNALLAGAFIDILLAMVLFSYADSDKPSSIRAAFPLFAGLATLLAIAVFSSFNIHYMTSSVFRHGQLLDNTTSLYHQDGKTATVDVIADLSLPTNPILSILTNGKPDAAISIGDTATVDEPTMSLIAWITLSLQKNASAIAIIGMGSGLTTHSALSYPGVEQVDTIEIEPAMVEGARLFGDRVKLSLTDPRSHIYIEDAKTFFTTHDKKYDVIISEPSNPWVSGIASLFSQEFYQHIKRHLNEQGLFAQWLHIYEINDALLGSIIKALSSQFDDYQIYQISSSDILLVAKPHGLISNNPDDLVGHHELQSDLARIGALSTSDIQTRYIGNKAFFDIYVSSLSLPANSDYFPVVDQGAAKARFTHEFSTGFVFKNDLFNLLNGREIKNLSSLSNQRYNPVGKEYHRAWLIRERILGRQSTYYFAQDDIKIQHFVSIFNNCQATTDWQKQALFINEQTTAYLPASDAADIWNKIRGLSCYKNMPAVTRHWVEIHQSFVQRDYASTLASIKALSAAAGKLPRELSQDPFYFQLFFISLIQQGMYEPVLAIWEKLPENLKIQEDINLLRLIAASRR